MDVRISFEDGIPILTLLGAFDAAGAQRFDDAAQTIETRMPSLVLDLAGVGYISSIGLRSLIALEKTLRARGGGLVIAGATRVVRQVLELTHLDTWLRSARDVREAVGYARSAAGPIAEHRVGACTIRVRTLDPGLCALEWWRGATGEQPAGDSLISVRVADLGFAFGVAGLGENAADARASLGLLMSTPAFAGVLPSVTGGLSDFIVGPASDAMPVHVASALGVTGKPTLVAAVTADTSIAFAEAMRHVVAIAAASRAVPRTIGFVARAASGSAEGILAVGVIGRDSDIVDDRGNTLLPAALRSRVPIDSDRTLTGVRVIVRENRSVAPAGFDGAELVRDPISADVLETIRQLANPDVLGSIAAIHGDDTLTRATVWLFLPSAVKPGAEKLLQIEVDGDVDWQPEWDTIVRRLFSDCRAATLTPLHGGFNSKTFRVVAYDREGRRTLPSVVKIGPTALTLREERAHREYVERFILNNGTTCLGNAEEGGWAGLRYNFLGVNGPESHLVWLRDHYLQRPTSELLPLFESLLTRVLKPWYAQPKWEQVWLYRDHTPLRLFPDLLEVAERELGVSCDDESFDCSELGLRLPNPFRFLKHEYPRRSAQSRLWYTAICHGDLNLQNVLVDERENLYVIDFSETRPRNAVSDFARIEPILKFEFTRLASDEDLRLLLELEAGLMSVARLGEPTPFVYRGNDPLVERAHAAIALLRRYADVVTLFEHDMTPYWLALLEWTYSVVAYKQVTPRQKRYAACSAALICRAIEASEA